MHGVRSEIDVAWPPDRAELDADLPEHLGIGQVCEHACVSSADTPRQIDLALDPFVKAHGQAAAGQRRY